MLVDTLETDTTVTETTSTSTSEPSVPAALPVSKAPAVSPAPSAVTSARAYTQAEVDELLGKVRTEGRQAAYRYLSKELDIPLLNENGVDLTAAKTIVREAREARSRDAATVQQLQDQIGQTQELVTTRENERNAALLNAKNVLRRGEIKVQALQLGFREPEDALQFLRDRLDTFDADLDAMTVAGVADALKQLAETRPYLLNSTTTTPPVIRATPSPTDERSAQIERDEVGKRDMQRFATSVFG